MSVLALYAYFPRILHMYTFSTSLALGLRRDTFIHIQGACSSTSAHNRYKQCVYDICTYILRALECC